jgi:hypothetical protein
MLRCGIADFDEWLLWAVSVDPHQRPITSQPISIRSKTWIAAVFVSRTLNKHEKGEGAALPLGQPN